MRTIFIPSAFVRTLVWKLLLHARRTHFGRYHGHGKLNTKLNVEIRIKQEPFDIIMYVHVADNCPPLQRQEIFAFENEMDQLIDDLINMNGIVGEYSWDNVFLMGALSMKEIGGKFYIKNYYHGKAEIKDVDSLTKSICFQFSLVKGNVGMIGIHSYSKIMKSGIKIINSDNFKFDPKNIAVHREKVL